MAFLQAAVPVPKVDGAPVLVNVYFEVDVGNGQTRKVRWPPNIDVVEGLLHSFDKSYTEAYRDECRVPPE